MAEVLDARELARLQERSLGADYKGIPLGVTTTLADLGNHGWVVPAGHVSLPTVTLRRSALESNVATMAEFCRRHGALLAPHGKTTMAPQLFDLQLAAGAWGLTCATPTQAAVMRRFGAPRVVLANEMTDSAAVRWVGRELDADPGFEFMCLVDSVAGVELMTEVLAPAGVRRPLDVLLEVGVPGGRCGVRDRGAAGAVAEACQRSPRLRLVGVEGYEGLVTSGGSPRDLAEVDAFLDRIHAVTIDLDSAGLFEGEAIVVTAGGSNHFDRVVARLSNWPPLSRPVSLVLRSGCYLTHDGAGYERVSPLAQREAGDEDLRLVNALTGWARVLSTPEPALVVVDAGKRDFPYDVELPIPRTVHRAAESASLHGRVTTTGIMDQHMFLRLDDAAPNVAVGDIAAFDLSHPCTAFDKNQLLFVVDDNDVVIGGVLTLF